MKRTCKKIQSLLATDGVKMLRTYPKAAAHVETCTQCFTFLETMSKIDTALEELPMDEAPQELVEKTLDQIKKTPLVLNKKRDPIGYRSRFFEIMREFFSIKRPLRFRFVDVLCVCVLLGLIGALTAPRMYHKIDRRGLLEFQKSVPSSTPKNLAQPTDYDAGYAGRGPESAGEEQKQDIFREKEAPAKMAEKKLRPDNEVTLEFSPPSPAESEVGLKKNTLDFYDNLRPDKVRTLKPITGKDLEPVTAPISPKPFEKHEQTDPMVTALSGAYVDNTSMFEPDKPGKLRKAKIKSLQNKGSVEDDGVKRLEGNISFNMEIKPKKKAKPIVKTSDAGILQAFLDERNNVNPTQFLDPTGYWANTYVPGDPQFRRLTMLMDKTHFKNIKPVAQNAFAPDKLMNQVNQPFDNYGYNAVDLFLTSDKRGIDGKSRLLVQVGLKGTQRSAGSRGAMNIGVVVEVRQDFTDQEKEMVKNLILSLNQAKDIADLFVMTIAGPSHMVSVRPEDFKYGFLSVTLAEAFDQKPSTHVDSDLIKAMQDTISSVGKLSNPNAPLGTSSIILITARPLDQGIEPLVELSHQSAVAGIPVSVIGVGDRIKVDQIDRIVLSGQGNRRLLNDANQAAELIDRELTAASRVIARAMRINIRLAKGVELVDVVGSHRLKAVAVTKVKAAEKSIDLRVARSLGIEADRGKDDDGIQIIVPAFYARDTHTILLDVVAQEPGPIADVSVKFKDLVNMRNTVLRAQLSLNRDAGEPGVLERNVTKNYLAYRLSETLKQSGLDLSAGNLTAALDRIGHVLSLYQQIQNHVPGFERDGDILTDIQVLKTYLDLLPDKQYQYPKPRNYLANSLMLAGYLKVLPRPQSWSGNPAQ